VGPVRVPDIPPLEAEPLSGARATEATFARDRVTLARPVRSTYDEPGIHPGGDRALRTARTALCVLLSIGALMALNSCEWFYALFGEPPTAVLIADPTSGAAPLVVSFDLSESTAPGGLQRFRLDFGDGSDFATGTEIDEPVVHTYAAAGTYTAALEVTSRYGQTDHDTESIAVGEAVEPGGEGPIAVLAADTTLGDAPLVVSFDVSLSSAPGSSLVSFRLDFGDGTAQYVGTNFSQPVIHLYAEVGLHTATLTVTDANGDTGTATLDIVATTADGGEAPVAAFDWTPAQPFIDEEVAFDAGASTDPARGIVEPQAIVVYTWDFGDGAEAATTAETVDHTYTWPGTYTVTLTVYDDDGVAGTATEEIDVRGAIAYVSSFFDGSVSQIHLPTNTVSDTIKPFEWSTGVAIDPDGASVYVGGASFVTLTTGVTRLRASDLSIQAQTGDLFDLPWDVACSPSGDVLYTVAGFFDVADELLVISPTTMTVIDTVPVQSYPSTVAFSPLGDFAYVVGEDPDSVLKIDTATRTVVDGIDLGGWPWGIAVSSDGEWALVTLYDTGEIVAIDLDDMTINIGDGIDLDSEVGYTTGPLGIALTHDDAFAYVTDYENGAVHVIDTALGTVIDTIDLEDDLYGFAWPWDVAISPGDSVAVVPFGVIEDDLWDWWGDSLPFVPSLPAFIIDLDTNEVVDTVVTGFGPLFVDIWGIGY